MPYSKPENQSFQQDVAASVASALLTSYGNEALLVAQRQLEVAEDEVREVWRSVVERVARS